MPTLGVQILGRVIHLWERTGGGADLDRREDDAFEQIAPVGSRRTAPIGHAKSDLAAVSSLISGKLRGFARSSIAAKDSDRHAAEGHLLIAPMKRVPAPSAVDAVPMG